MFNVDMIYNRATLYILVEGNLNKKNIFKLKERLYNIVKTYNILNIVLDVKKTNILDEIAFYDFLDDYDMKYEGKLKVLEAA